MNYNRKDSENTAVKAIMQMIANGEISQEVAEKYYPELKESEDERIRKHLIGVVELYYGNTDEQEKKDCLAWLEKQGEQKLNPVLDIEIPFGAKDSELQEASYHIPEGFHAEIEGNRVVIKRGEQKPVTDFSDLRTWKYIVDAVWTEKEGIGQYLDSSFTEEVAKKLQKRFGKTEQKPAELSEEDNQYLLVCKNALAKYQKTDHWDADIISRWLENKVKQTIPQPKQEWSECNRILQDASISYLCNLRDTFEAKGWDKEQIQKCINWLKSIRPQNRWKESLATADLENSLCDIQDGFSDTSYEYRILGEAIEFIRCTDPKPQWKPSNEQINELSKAVDYYTSHGFPNRITCELLEQLKKL